MDWRVPYNHVPGDPQSAPFPEQGTIRPSRVRRSRGRKSRQKLKARKLQEHLLKEEMYQSRVLTQVQVIPEPTVESGPLLYDTTAPVQAGQHVVQQQQQQELPPPMVQQPVAQPPVAQPPLVQQSHYQSLTTGAAPAQAVPQVSDVHTKEGISEDFLELNSSNAATIVALNSDILLGGSASQWHQITIKTPVQGSKRKYVLMAINRRISPLKINPYFFRMENNRITFFVNMCSLALKTLCRQDLKVPYISDKFVEIEMTIKLFSKNFNLSEALKEIISRRLDSQKKFLDLSCINDIPEVQEMLYDPTENWHILDQMLRVAEVAAPGLIALGLAGNGITSLTALWELLAHTKWKSLRTLDLSDNKIKSTGTVSLPRTLQISEVYLDHNPICQMHNKSPYISAIKATFPRLAKLDGTYLHTSACIPYWKPNFIVNGAGDLGEFADQFIEHFFTLYDDSDRMKLRGLYHKNAYFSLSCLCLDAQMTTPNARLSAYLGESRNLLRCSNMKNVRTALTQGSEEILERLSNLPNTQHDPCTFAVDLTVHTPKFTILTVTGVFRDMTKEKSSHRHFSRTFVLKGQENEEYQITNDILYISNASTREAEEAFRFVRPSRKIKKNRLMPNLSECEKESMAEMVQQLTSMSAPWSRKCLEDTDWDLKEALEIFVELYETSKIPKSAFVNSI
ncbi:nuclear RNA export factor 1-like isoform X1 [Schistocerca serialis cubense]|uniref:nuclear RNA export factor 1-like isoform X1 n=1 Tax=Schistocerca serialis cubense TaxID=2023355 RepID=UPI00214E5B4E|nr:nuclear RNA export factor 1-like isoform X1 [Schistocerca serialis cubense]XP_049943490.1 nuclear RNA export factor 1-like isoform X1 [Schistocerca serialis cubense]